MRCSDDLTVDEERQCWLMPQATYNGNQETDGAVSTSEQDDVDLLRPQLINCYPIRARFQELKLLGDDQVICIATGSLFVERMFRAHQGRGGRWQREGIEPREEGRVISHGPRTIRELLQGDLRLQHMDNRHFCRRRSRWSGTSPDYHLVPPILSSPSASFLTIGSRRNKN
ncbi:hypothetical protein MLD38_032495 [Melastoma candidum]|uniref:Uncharacterized protein n=1 Tax=Melastoma candidum TaxID=119954 RepID=A0ACB9M4D1_9MYRT|nr:hypothetical protein MLD38_032495 [Melastoma candidum]